MSSDTIYIIAAVVLSLALLLFSFERFMWRWVLMARVRFSWFPYGRFILFVCPEGHPQMTYIEREILPVLGDAVYYLKLSPVGRRGADPEMRFGMTLARWFMEPDRTGPVAIVFKTGYEYERIDFSEALDALGEGSDKMVCSKRDRLVRVAEAMADRIRVYL